MEMSGIPVRLSLYLFQKLPSVVTAKSGSSPLPARKGTEGSRDMTTALPRSRAISGTALSSPGPDAARTAGPDRLDSSFFVPKYLREEEILCRMLRTHKRFAERSVRTDACRSRYSPRMMEAAVPK